MSFDSTSIDEIIALEKADVGFQFLNRIIPPRRGNKKMAAV